MEHYHGYSFPSPLPTITPLRNRVFCKTEDMILFYLLLKQNALIDLLLIGVFLILFKVSVKENFSTLLNFVFFGFLA